ncbi:MAG: PDZ domain-containing protein, partial [Gammaproteobacteria bacterium]|nr:PDZ domain-containing protein [Gammaproteobacteria bacterium]
HNLPVVALGARLLEENSTLKITHVYDQGSAMQAGLSSGDVIIAADGLKVNKACFEKMIAASSSGDKIKLHVFRRDELMEFNLTLLNAEEDTCVFELQKNPDKNILVNRQKWLHVSTE